MAPEHAVTSAIILAGGLGTRLRSAVPDLPKAMAPIRGRPFLEYQLEYWIRQGVDHFVLAVGYRHQAIIDHFGHAFEGARLEYMVESTPLGTGGALLRSARLLSPTASFLLLNGDTYFEVDLAALIKFSVDRDADWCFSLARSTDVERYLGIEVSVEGKVASLKSVGSRLVNGGVYWIRPQALNKLSASGDMPLSLENEILPSSQSSGLKMYALEFSGAFIDIGIPADYERAQDLLPELAACKGYS